MCVLTTRGLCAFIAACLFLALSAIAEADQDVEADKGPVWPGDLRWEITGAETLEVIDTAHRLNVWRGETVTAEEGHKLLVVSMEACTNDALSIAYNPYFFLLWVRREGESTFSEAIGIETSPVAPWIVVRADGGTTTRVDLVPPETARIRVAFVVRKDIGLHDFQVGVMRHVALAGSLTLEGE